MSKRRRGYPSERNVKRGHRIVHGNKELVEKLGKDDLCPCGSGRRFQALLPEYRAARRLDQRLLLLGIDTAPGSAYVSIRYLVGPMNLMVYHAVKG